MNCAPVNRAAGARRKDGPLLEPWERRRDRAFPIHRLMNKRARRKPLRRVLRQACRNNLHPAPIWAILSAASESLPAALAIGLALVCLVRSALDRQQGRSEIC